MSKKLHLVWLVAWLFSYSLSWAARSAVVKSEEVIVYELPNNQSAVLAKVKKGDQIVVSNLPTDGYHRLKLGEKLGWVEGDQLQLGEMPPEEQIRAEAAPFLPKKEDKKASGAKRGPAVGPVHRMRRSFHLNLSGGLEMMGMAGVLANQAKFGQGYGFGGELSYSLTDEWSVVVRGEYLMNLNALVSNGKTYNINISAIPVFMGPQFSFNGDFFSVSLGLLGGAMVSPTLSAAIGSATPVTYANDPAFTFLGRLLAEWQATKWLALLIEAGYRYGITSTATSLSITSGTVNEILNQSFFLDFSGPMVHAGVSIGF